MFALVDHEIKRKISNNELITSSSEINLNLQDASSQIQPASIDLTIGEICLPDSQEGGEKFDVQRIKKTFKRSIGPGECIRVFTTESLNFTCSDSSYMGLIFAPARVSRKGLFIMDVGIVDPGFKGNLGFTVINFGKETVTLKIGDSIASLVIFDLDALVERPWISRSGEQPYEGRYKDIHSLSPDFLKVVEKAKRAAEVAAQECLVEYENNYFRKFVIPAILSAALGFFVGIGGILAVVQTKVFEISDRVSTIENELEELNLEP